MTSSTAASGTAGPDPSDPPSTEPALEDLDVELSEALKRFRNPPPSLHGTYEYRSTDSTLAYELWVDWPAFRLTLTATENAGPTAGEISDPLIIATVDGKRFGVRDPASHALIRGGSLDTWPDAQLLWRGGVPIVVRGRGRCWHGRGP